MSDGRAEPRVGEPLVARSDAALLAERERLDEAFAVFYRRHVGGVLRFCASRGLAAAEAADVTAETFAAALLARRRYQPERAGAREWLLGIAAHKLSDRVRRRARERLALQRLGIDRIEFSAHDEAVYAALGGGADGGAALDALSTLPAGQREAVTARIVEEQDYATIGRRFGLSEAAARRRVSRGLAALRVRLKED
jgi:RNA polymerase sigma-70 factor (ECF subfamily)